METPVPYIISWETLVVAAAMTVATAVGLLLFALLQAWGYVVGLRTLGLGGERATFGHAAVVVLCAMPFVYAASAIARDLAAAGDLDVLGAAALSYALVLPIHLVAAHRGFRLQGFEAVQLLMICSVGWSAVCVGASLGIGLLLRYPVIAVAVVPIGAAVAIGRFKSRASDRRLLEAYASSGASDSVD